MLHLWPRASHSRRAAPRRRARLTLLVLAPLALVAGVAGCALETGAAAGGAAEPVELVRVYDGDTLLVRWQGKEEKVRLIGVDAPEGSRGGRPEAGAVQALVRAREWAEGRRLGLVFDPGNAGNEHRDRYGRLLAYVQDAKGEDLGRLLLEEGLGRLFRKFDFERREAYARAEETARRAGRGLWAGGAEAELAALAGAQGAAISLFATGGDLWAICMAGQARMEVRPGELPSLLRRLRQLQLGRQGSALAQALQEEGFRPASRACPAP